MESRLNLLPTRKTTTNEVKRRVAAMSGEVIGFAAHSDRFLAERMIRLLYSGQLIMHIKGREDENVERYAKSNLYAYAMVHYECKLAADPKLTYSTWLMDYASVSFSRPDWTPKLWYIEEPDDSQEDTIRIINLGESVFREIVTEKVMALEEPMVMATINELVKFLDNNDDADRLCTRGDVDDLCKSLFDAATGAMEKELKRLEEHPDYVDWLKKYQVPLAVTTNEMVCMLCRLTDDMPGHPAAMARLITKLLFDRIHKAVMDKAMDEAVMNKAVMDKAMDKAESYLEVLEARLDTFAQPSALAIDEDKTE